MKIIKINVDNEFAYAKIELSSGRSTLREVGTGRVLLGGVVECRVALAVSSLPPRN